MSIIIIILYYHCRDNNYNNRHNDIEYARTLIYLTIMNDIYDNILENLYREIKP
jgi:hypothetical protein